MLLLYSVLAAVSQVWKVLVPISLISDLPLRLINRPSPVTAITVGIPVTLYLLLKSLGFFLTSCVVINLGDTLGRKTLYELASLKYCYIALPLFCFGGCEPDLERPGAHLADLRPPAAADHAAIVAGHGDHRRDPRHFVLAPQIAAVMIANIVNL